ncbi:hypothetical protein IWW52_000788 [Coemansia sp. RSA 2704]|nr:hypothetical protein IWW52_000788 [Coemansia sp. RSA 2704]
MEEDRHLRYLSELQQSVGSWQPWLCTLAEVADKLGVDPSRGLDHLEARNRYQHFGANVPVLAGQRLHRVLAAQLLTLTTQLLAVICLLYSLWGDLWDSVAVCMVALSIIGLRVYAEWRANRALASLRDSVPVNTTVLRSGREGIVSSNELVLGDVIMLSRGQLVPADAVVVVCHGFAADESLVTGEPNDVGKAALDSAEHGGAYCGAEGEHYPLPEDARARHVDRRQALVYAGTRVSSGRAVCIVVATGRFTEIGSDAGAQRDDSQLPATRLQLRLQRLTDTLTVSAAVCCLAIAVIGIIRGMDLLNAALLGVSLAFATVPAAIPLIAKGTLALGSQQLSHSGLLVRKLHTADALSAISVIVTDKTGTLTRNQLVVSSVLTITADADGQGLAVDVVTPEAAMTTERSAALVTPLYCAWSLSVDPLEARPLARLLATVQRKATARHNHDDHPGFQPVRGFGKDFMNTAVLHSLSAEGDDLLRDSETDAVPLESIARSVTTMCQRLSVPTGELAFDPTLRISALTRSTARLPVYSPMRPATANLDSGVQSPSSSANKHWTVIKGAAEVLLPLCSRVWRANSDGLQLSDEAIDSGRVDGIINITPSFIQTISRNTTDLAVAGNRVIAYAIAITDEPLFAAKAAKPKPAADSPLSTPKRELRDDHAYRFRGSEASTRRSANLRGEGVEAIPTIEIARGQRAPLLPSDLVFVGAFAFFDPPQQEARPVVQECQEAGIRVIVATGDHPSTALSVASAVGISESHSQPTASYGTIPMPTDRHRSPTPNLLAPSEIHAITGEMIERSLTNHTFEQLIDESNVFARITPAQKLRLVNALRARGDVVAFIGDGINDAPPLTRADVGICMGGHPSTADVAMDAAGLIVLSGDFSGVVRSLREGRRQSANIDKALTLYIAGKLALVLLFALLLITEGVSPLMPIQLLLIALFMDAGAAFAFVGEPAEGHGGECTLTAQQTAEPASRQRTGSLSSYRTDRAVAYSLLLALTCALPLLVPFLVLPQWAMAPVAPSIVFLTYMLAYSLLGLTVRTRAPWRLQPRANSLSTIWTAGWLVAVVLAALPFRARLGLVKLDFSEWVLVLGAPLLLFIGLEAFKELRFNRAQAEGHLP